MTETVQLTLHTAMSAVPAQEVSKLIADLASVLRGCSTEPDDTYVTGIKTGSVVIDMAASSRRCENLERSLRRLSAGAPLVGWSPSQVRAMQRIVEVGCRRGDATIGISGQEIIWSVRTLKAPLERVLPEPHRAYGSVSGRLYRYSNRDGHPTADVEAVRTGHRVTVILNSELSDTTKKLLDTEVVVYGQLVRDSDTNEVISVTASGVVPARKSSGKLPVEQYAGILGSDWMDGKTAVELVREYRDVP